MNIQPATFASMISTMIHLAQELNFARMKESCEISGTRVCGQFEVWHDTTGQAWYKDASARNGCGETIDYAELSKRIAKYFAQ